MNRTTTAIVNGNPLELQKRVDNYRERFYVFEANVLILRRSVFDYYYLRP